jgi:polysaccharide biosynthesis/export protein
VARYTQGQNIDEPLAMERGSATNAYEADGLASITSLAAANGTIAQSYTYDSFGNTANERQLKRPLCEYVRYYHEDRTDLVLGKGTPGESIPTPPVGSPFVPLKSRAPGALAANPVDTPYRLGHIVLGSSLSMAVRIRGVSDRLLPQLVVVAAVLGALLSPSVTCGQQKVETSKQTNERIQQLASRARPLTGDIPIGAGDVVHVDVFDVPELSRDLRVSESGDMSFPLIPGRIHVVGQSPFQLEATIEQLLLENGLVSHPQVSVFVKEQNSQPLSIVGAVPHPMVYQVLRPTTLIEVLADAGGIADDAGPDIIITRPKHPGELRLAGDPGSDPPGTDPPSETPADDTQVLTIHLQDLLESGDTRFDIPVYGGDVVRVPKAGIIYILGQGIAAPGGYILQGHGEKVTVLKAVALAHGLTSFAKADSSVILRTDPATGKRVAITVHIKKIEKHKEDDVPVVSNDILYIPDSAGKKALARGGEAAIGIGTGVSVYRAY